jgi:LysM repeat protein
MPQVAVLALMSVGFAGCSADMQTRFSDFSNPFASQPEATGSVRSPAAERRDLPQYSRPQASSAPQYQSQPLPAPAVAAPNAYPASSGGVSGGGRGISSYAPPSRSPIETTATVPPRSVAAARPAAQNGTTIIVGTSDTLDLLAKRYNVSAAAILQANGYKGPRVLSPGQQLIIPKQTAVAAAAPALAPAASKPVAVAAAPSSVHIVNRGDTLMSIARRNHVPVGELAKANNLDQSAKLSLGMKLTVPGSKSAAAAPVAQPGAGHQDGRSRRSAAERAAGVCRDQCRRRKARRRSGVGQIKRSHRRAAHLPLAGARQGDHELRRQDQRQIE